MIQHRYEEMLQHRISRATPWDKLPAKNVTFDGLDHSLIRRIWEQGIEKGRISDSISAENTETILQRFKLITEEGQLNNAVVLLFCKDMPAQ